MREKINILLNPQVRGGATYNGTPSSLGHDLVNLFSPFLRIALVVIH
jgi:hypothetical protein